MTTNVLRDNKALRKITCRCHPFYKKEGNMVRMSKTQTNVVLGFHCPHVVFISKLNPAVYV